MFTFSDLGNSDFTGIVADYFFNPQYVLFLDTPFFKENIAGMVPAVMEKATNLFTTDIYFHPDV